MAELRVFLRPHYSKAIINYTNDDLVVLHFRSNKIHSFQFR